MPLVLEDAPFRDVFSDQRRQADEALRRAALEAQQRNDAQVSNSVRLADGRDAARSQLDALARQAEAQTYSRNQDQLQQQRQDQAFQRQGDWHDQNQQQEGLVFKRQADWHNEEIARRAAESLRHDMEVKARQEHERQLAEGNAARIDSRGAQRALENQTLGVFKEIPTLPFDVAQGVAKRFLGQEPAPELRPEEMSLALPQFEDEPGTMGAPDPVGDALRRIETQRNDRSKRQVHDQTMERERLNLQKEKEQRIAEADKSAFEEKQKYRNSVARDAELKARNALKEGRDFNTVLDKMTLTYAGVPADWDQNPTLVAEAQRLSNESKAQLDAIIAAFPPAQNPGRQYPLVLTPEQALRKIYPGHGTTHSADAIMKIEEVRQKLQREAAEQAPAPVAPQVPQQPVIAVPPVAPPAPPPAPAPKGVTTAAPGSAPVAPRTGQPEQSLPVLVMNKSQAEVIPVMTREQAKSDPSVMVWREPDGNVYRRRK